MNARILLVATALALPVSGLNAQGTPATPPTQVVRDTTPPRSYFGVTEHDLARRKLERILPDTGFVLYVIGDMEGLAGVVRNGTEMSPGRVNNPDYQNFRQELTDEINAVIAGARAAGASTIVVNEGHGASNFHNILPEKLDQSAILIRGWPRPNVMQTGINKKVSAMMIVGAHPNAGSNGIIAHSYAFDSFTVNGHPLNETGIAAFVGGEFGVPLILAAGDDALTSETRDMLGPIETVTVKTALGRAAGASKSFARVHAELRAAATRAVQRLKAGQLKPLVFEKPYHVHYCIRRSFPDWQLALMSKADGIKPDGSGDSRCFNLETNSAEAVGTVLNETEWSALKP